MSRDLTLVRIDVIWRPVERIASAIPGIGSDEEEESRREGAGRSGAGRGARLGEPTADDPATESDARGVTGSPRPAGSGERSTGTSRSGGRSRSPVGETPPPGPTRPPREESEPAGDGKGRLLLLAGVGIAAVGALVAAGAVLWKRKSGDDGGGSGVTDKLPVIGGDDEEDEVTVENQRESGRMDAAPIVGMTALAGMSAIVRRLPPYP